MNSDSIEFIDYDAGDSNDFFPKLEMELDGPKPFEKFEDNYFDDPFQQNLRVPALDRLNSDFFNSIFQSESQQTSLAYQTSESDQQQSLQINQEKREELSTTSDDASTQHAFPDPISTKSRRIAKREKAKQAAEQKHKQKQTEKQKQQKEQKEKDAKQTKLTEAAILSGEIPAKFIPEGFHENLDEKSKKKMLQMIRNRISAQNSRDRKRNLIDHLEGQQRNLCEENVKLKGKIRQLEQENASLRQENQEIKRAMKGLSTVGKDQLPSGIFPSSFDDPSSNPSTGSPNMSVDSSPVFRQVMRSGGFMKYSLALATIFAVLMFNGMNTTANLPATPGDLVSNAAQQPIFQAPAPKTRRLLEDAPSTGLIVPELKPIVLKMEEEYATSPPYATTDLSDYPFISELNNLQRNFNEKYMSQFFSQLKIVDPAVLKSFQQSLNLTIVPDQKSDMDINFPTYLRASRRQLPDYSKSKDSNQIVPFIGGNSKLPFIKNDNFSSLFCPSGFEFQSESDGSFVKVEADAIAPQKKLKILDSEWLQLFVPKSNISVAKLTDQDGLYINPTENDPNDDNTIVEVWAKVFFIRELPSGF